MHIFRISFQRHFYGLCQGFKYGFYLMMFVFSLYFYVQVATGGIGERFEEMVKHFRRHIPDFFPFEFSRPYQPAASAEVKGYLGEGFIHRQGKSVTGHALFIFECK